MSVPMLSLGSHSQNGLPSSNSEPQALNEEAGISKYGTLRMAG